jgi:hypothetical protein
VTARHTPEALFTPHGESASLLVAVFDNLMIFYNFIKNIDLKVSAEAKGFNPMIQTIK